MTVKPAIEVTEEELRAVGADDFRSRSHDGRNSVFVGDRGTGKSTKAKALALYALCDSRGKPREGVLGIYVTTNGPDSDPWPGVELSPADLDRLLAESEPDVPPLIVVRGGPYAYHRAAELAMLCCEQFRVLLIVDECHRVFREHFGDNTPMAEMFHEGRHRGVDVYFITQWPARADKRLIRSCDAVFWFSLITPEDLEWIAKRYSERAAIQVEELPDYSYVLIERDRPPAEWRWRADKRDRAESAE